MREEDRDYILALIEKMRLAKSADALDVISADLKTIVMMAADPELEWAGRPPIILTQGGRTFRAQEIR